MIERSGPGKDVAAYRTIGEVAEDLHVPQHVLRFWETRFAQIRPLKRAGGRRFYRPEDVALLRAVQTLLYADGYTIKGVQRLLDEFGAQHVAEALARATLTGPAAAPDGGGTREGRRSAPFHGRRRRDRPAGTRRRSRPGRGVPPCSSGRGRASAGRRHRRAAGGRADRPGGMSPTDVGIGLYRWLMRCREGEDLRSRRRLRPLTQRQRLAKKLISGL